MAKFMIKVVWIIKKKGQIKLKKEYFYKTLWKYIKFKKIYRNFLTSERKVNK
jgi:hypothetical protein